MTTTTVQHCELKGCGLRIRVMAYMNTGACCQRHLEQLEKQRSTAGDKPVEKP